MGVQGMTKLQKLHTGAIEPQQSDGPMRQHQPVRPVWPKQRVGLIRLGKVLMLGFLLTATTIILGITGKAVSAAVLQSSTQAPIEVVEMVNESAPAALVLADSVNQATVTKNRIAGLAGLAAAFFWLWLAAVNVRRKGDMDNRSDQHLSDQIEPPGLSVVSGSAVRG